MNSPRTCSSSASQLQRRLTCAVIALALAVIPRAAHAQDLDPHGWFSDGSISCSALDGGTLYLGGDFHYLGPATGSYVPIDMGTGVTMANWPRVDGPTIAAISDNAGGVYLGGLFLHVGGVARPYLAHVRADGTLDP